MAEEAESMHRQAQAYARHDLETIVLDLARVRTIDTLGLHTIILLYNQLCRNKGELIIENASRELKKRFQLMTIQGRLTISRTGWPCEQEGAAPGQGMRQRFAGGSRRS